MKYETIEDLQKAEAEIAEVDRMLDHESDKRVTAAISELAGGFGAAGVGVAGGFAAVYFAGVVGMSAAGITSGLAAVGAVIGGGMLAGIGMVIAAPLVLFGGGYFLVRRHRAKKFNDARGKIRGHAIARKEFLERLIREKGDLGDLLDKYRAQVERMTTLISDLA